MVRAKRYIEEGEHRRAIEAYEDALENDTQNKELRAALEEAQAGRFMSAARFERVKEGMGPEEVKALLGPVNLRNIREFREEKMLAWFYPTDEGGGTARVLFREDQPKGKLFVYRTNFEEVKSAR